MEETTRLKELDFHCIAQDLEGLPEGTNRA